MSQVTIRGEYCQVVICSLCSGDMGEYGAFVFPYDILGWRCFVRVFIGRLKEGKMFTYRGEL